MERSFKLKGVHVEDFGAIATTGATKPIDSTDAIQRAYSAAMTLGVPLLLQGGHYGITHLDFFDDVPSSGRANATTVKGHNSKTYLRVLTDSPNYSPYKPAITIGNERSYLRRLVFEDFILLPWNKEDRNTGDGILLRKASNGSRMLGVEVRGMKDGIVINDSFTVNFLSCNFSQNRRHGVYAPKVQTEGGSYTYNNNMGFVNCVCNFNEGSGIVTESRSVSILSTNCEGNKLHQFSAEGAAVFVEGMYSESLPTTPYACINLKDCNGGFIASNYLDTWGGSTGDKILIRLTGTTHGVTVMTGGYNVRSGTRAVIVELDINTSNNTIFCLKGNTINDKSVGKNSVVWTDTLKNKLQGTSNIKHYGVVSHNLGTVPSSIQITPITTEPCFVSIIPDTITASYFNVSIKKANGSIVETPIDIMWEVTQ